MTPWWLPPCDFPTVLQVVWKVDPLSWSYQDGDVSWLFGAEADGQHRWVRGGVRMAARAIIIHFASRYLYGDWTPALMAYSAAAATLAPSDAAQIWVTGDNFPMVHRIVEAHRRHADALFRGDSVEDQLQFGTPDGVRRPEEPNAPRY